MLTCPLCCWLIPPPSLSLLLSCPSSSLSSCVDGCSLWMQYFVVDCTMCQTQQTQYLSLFRLAPGRIRYVLIRSHRKTSALLYTNVFDNFDWGIKYLMAKIFYMWNEMVFFKLTFRVLFLTVGCCLQAAFPLSILPTWSLSLFTVSWN